MAMKMNGEMEKGRAKQEAELRGYSKLALSQLSASQLTLLLSKMGVEVSNVSKSVLIALCEITAYHEILEHRDVPVIVPDDKEPSKSSMFQLTAQQVRDLAQEHNVKYIGKRATVETLYEMGVRIKSTRKTISRDSLCRLPRNAVFEFARNLGIDLTDVKKKSDAIDMIMSSPSQRKNVHHSQAEELPMPSPTVNGL